MYEKRFGLKRRPFPTTLNLACYYPATPHEQVLAAQLRALHDEEGMTLVVGEAGVGKTLLAQILLDRVGDVFDSAFLTNSHFADRTALLQAILYDLGLPHEHCSEQELRLRLTDHCLRLSGEGRRALLVVDEAQNLSDDHLEELRLLGNLEAEHKTIQIVLLAQSSIFETLEQPRLASFRQRLVARGTLAPLGAEEAMDYLLHHVRWAGGRAEAIFDEEGLATLARGCRGVPRLLNQAGHQALTLADSGDMGMIDTEIALEALASLGLHADEDEGADNELKLRQAA
jgi:type II secretory pathway predicted ATPase ExeA